MNNYITNIYKQKKYQGFLDSTAPNNKNIFIETDSEPQKSDRNLDNFQKNTKKSTQLLIAKTESQFPETFNSQNVFRRDGLVKGYYIKATENKNIMNVNNKYNTISNKRMVRTVINSPSEQSEGKILNEFNFGAQTQIRQKKENNMNLLNQTYNRNAINNTFFKKEMDLDEWPSIEKIQKSGIYYTNKEVIIGEKNSNESENSNDTENQNQIINFNQSQNMLNENIKKKTRKYPVGMVYSKRNITEMKASYSKSNISDISEDFINQYKKQQETENLNENKNYIIAGNASEIATPMDFKNTNDIVVTSEDESDRHGELAFSSINYQNINKKIIRKDSNDKNVLGNDQGGKVDLYYGLINHKKETIIKKKKVIVKKNIYISAEDIIKNDISKLNLLIKLQRFIKSYLYLRELCAMKIQAVWRGGNTRKIMDLYNDLDEFIYHLSKVQFNHFNNDFCFFIKQLFNIYKANISNGNYKESFESENNENVNNNDEDENEEDNENENCMNQISLEEDIDQKESIEKYSYKFPDGGFFDPDKLEPENEIDLFVEASSSSYYERRKRNKSKDYDRLLKDYDDLYQQYNELLLLKKII